MSSEELEDKTLSWAIAKHVGYPHKHQTKPDDEPDKQYKADWLERKQRACMQGKNWSMKTERQKATEAQNEGKKATRSTLI